MSKDQTSGLFERMIKKAPCLESIIKILVIMLGWLLFSIAYLCEFMAKAITMFLAYLDELKRYAKEVWTTDFW